MLRKEDKRVDWPGALYLEGRCITLKDLLHRLAVMTGYYQRPIGVRHKDRTGVYVKSVDYARNPRFQDPEDAN